MNNINVTFLGAAGCVTGSKFLVQSENYNVLIDCGLFQGLRELREENWKNLPVDVKKIDAVILTHGHLDHVGYLPLLVKQGFTGAVYATQPTIDIAKIVLEDSAHIQEEDAERANKNKYSKHHPALPLYTLEETLKLFPLFKAKPINQWLDLAPGVSFRMNYNGHILGAVWIELNIHDKILVFSGDVGRISDPIMRRPEKPEKADVLFIESTYGDRQHPAMAMKILADAINNAAKKNGTILIPAFAVERTQLLMYYIHKLQAENKIPALPVYVDTPMGIHVLEVFKRYPIWHKLSLAECEEICNRISIIKNYKDSQELAKSTHPKIIIAGSGMTTGNRILSYFVQYLGNANASVLLAGYQAEGTRGHALLNGAKEIKIYGKWWPVHASVYNVEGLSAHADQVELLNWIDKISPLPAKVFLIHGERKAALALQNILRVSKNTLAIIPELYGSVQL